MIKKLRTKLIIASMLSLLIVLAIILGTAGILNYQNLVSDADSVLSLLAENDGHFPEPDIPAAGQPASDKMHRKDSRFSPELPYESRYFSALMDSSGNVITVNTGKIAAVDTSTAIQYAKTVWESGNESGFTNDYRYMVYTSDAGTHILFLDCGRSLDSFRTFMYTSMAVSLAGLLGVLLLLILLSGRIVKPFSENYEKQKRFITDAGHELKTPLTIIDSDAEVLEMDYGKNEWLSDIQDQTKRLADLTNSLILLARMEEEQPRMARMEFPLSDIAEDTVETFQALAKKHGKLLTCKIQPMVSMVGDERAVRQLFSILLDNAIKYSDDGGNISLTLDKQKNYIFLRVFNTAQSVPRDCLGHLFDRFYRMEPSRNSQTGGYGLGLSIAAAIVNAHKGKIIASTSDEKSLLITITFPIA